MSLHDPLLTSLSILMCHHHNIRKLITVRQLGADVFDHQKSFSDFLITLQQGQHAFENRNPAESGETSYKRQKSQTLASSIHNVPRLETSTRHRRLSIILKIRHYEKSEKEDIVAAIEHNAPEHSSYT